MANFEEEDVDTFIEETVVDDALGDLERRRELEMAGRLGADIAFDLQDRGPLYLYVKQRRKLAKDALHALVEIDPGDGINIAALQAAVREYLTVCEWIHLSNEAAILAETTIEEEFGDNGREEQID